jgi:tetratricopeptide (TPR) repeat protein
MPITSAQESENKPPPLADTPSFRRSLWMIEDIEHSLRLVPDDAERNYALALIHVMRGKFNDAIKTLRQAVEANPKHANAMWLLGEIYLKTGDYEKAAESLEQVVTQEPDNLTAITWLSLAYHSLGKRGKALDIQSVLQNIAPDLVVSRSLK